MLYQSIRCSHVPAPFTANLLVILNCAMQSCRLETGLWLLHCYSCHIKVEPTVIPRFLRASRLTGVVIFETDLLSVCNHGCFESCQLRLILRCLLKGVYPLLTGGVGPPYSDWVTVSLLLTGNTKPRLSKSSQVRLLFRDIWNVGDASVAALNKNASQQRVNDTDIHGCPRWCW